MDKNKVAAELVSIAKSLLAAKITRSTVMAVLRKMGIEDKVTVDSEYVEFWPESFIDSEAVKDWHDGDKVAEKAADMFSNRIGGATIISNGSYYRVRWKGDVADMGDWNDKSSRWHR